MSRAIRTALAIVAAAFALAQAPAFAQDPSSAFGTWRNPKDTVHIELKPCGDGACGFIVWASAKAEAAARKAGTPNLIGLQLFRNMTVDEKGRWRGEVFVPDLNRTISGRAEAVDEQTLRARGCLLAGVLCKSQLWTRAG